MTKHTHSWALPILLCALLCAGCIQSGEDPASDGSYLLKLTESQTAALDHLGVIIESQNSAINAFNDHDYAACRIWCIQTAMQNEEYASLVGVHAGLVTNASLPGSDGAYYEAQLDMLQAFQRNINQSTFDLDLACEYTVAGDDVHSQHHIIRAGEFMEAFHDNIDRFNDNVDARNRELDNFTSPVPDPSNWINSPGIVDTADTADTTGTANTTLSGRVDLSEIPDPYYLSKTNFQNTPDEVQRLLGKGFFTSYACSSFDCSEMAAYIEWKLECHNVTAQIATKDNWEGEYGHAWIIVPLRGGNNLAIEPTISAMEGSLGAEMITYDPKYFVCDHLFDDIYGASEFFGIEEWDWWDKLELN